MLRVTAITLPASLDRGRGTVSMGIAAMICARIPMSLWRSIRRSSSLVTRVMCATRSRPSTWNWENDEDDVDDCADP